MPKNISDLTDHVVESSRKLIKQPSKLFNISVITRYVEETIMHKQTQTAMLHFIPSKNQIKK